MDTPGFLLRGRNMAFIPWRKNLFRNSPSFSQPGKAVIHVVNTFREEGGDVENLVLILNRHIPSVKHRLDEVILFDEKTSYSLEFFYYLIQFSKDLLNNPFFRYLPVSGDVGNEHHSYFERGPVDGVLWKSANEDGVTDGYLSMANVKNMFVYAEESLLKDFSLAGSCAGLEPDTSALVLKLINSSVPEDAQVERSFFEREHFLVSYSYLFLVSAVFRSIFNKPDFVHKALYEGFLKNSQLSQAIFAQSAYSPAEGFRMWQMRTSNSYKMEFKESLMKMKVGFNLRKQMQLGLFDLYRESCIEAIHQGNSGATQAFFELASGRPVRIRVDSRPGKSTDFTVVVYWRSPTRLGFLVGFSLLAGTVFALLLYFAIS